MTEAEKRERVDRLMKRVVDRSYSDAAVYPGDIREGLKVLAEEIVELKEKINNE